MTTPLRRPVALFALGVAAGLGAPLRAQSGGAHVHGTAAPRSSGSAIDANASHAAHEAMSGALSDNLHLRMSPVRAATAADSARATAIVDEARAALARYRNVRVAEREGYTMFAPNVKQPVYHFTQTRAAIRAEFTFDVTRPTSLLYREDVNGTLTLVGAMYTAPKDATWDELDARVPLGIARWHLHTNMCVPRLRELARWREVEDGLPVFGPTSPIATRQACDAVDGRFLPVVFNWMVHVNMFEADAWADHH